jgi:flagellar assembly protein FliH
MKTSSSETRPARFDRPLTPGGAPGDSGLSWGDAETDRRVSAAVQAGLEQGRAAGYAAGWAQGRQAAAEAERADAAARAAADAALVAEQSDRVGAVLAALRAAADERDAVTEPAWTELADTITDGALAIARAAIARELASVTPPVLASVRAAVRTLACPGPVTVRVHPIDLSALETVAGHSIPAQVRLLADPALAPGEVLVVGPAQQLRLALPAAVAAAEEVLRG